MNPAVKKMWQDALLSDEYAQGSGALRTLYDEYCCLGVLCDLYAKATGKGRWEAVPLRGYNFVEDQFDRSFGFLTEGVRKWAGLPTVSPDVPVGNGTRLMLSHLNDNRTPFPHIAKLLDSL